MVNSSTYSLRKIYKKNNSGITKPKFCSLGAILKSDGGESPQCVYNEQVATNLAQVLHVPNAMGVLTDATNHLAFASLEISKPSVPLPNIRRKWFDEVSQLYPNEVAALVIFDIFIGNSDRYQNLKVSLLSKANPIFMAFDHSHALLHPYHEPNKAIQILHSDNLIATHHTFYGLVQCQLLHNWVQRFQDLPDYLITECCEMGKPINTVQPSTQSKLAKALVWRKNNLHTIVASNTHIIRCLP